jgi:gag-polypeptide of LTR copia-type
MKEGAEVRDHINELNQIVMDLASVDIKIDSEDQALKLFYSLPSSCYNSTCADFLLWKEIRLYNSDQKK